MSRTEEMRRVVARWERSGLSMKAFAEAEGIPYSTFSYWRRRLAEEPRLVPVRIVEDTVQLDERDAELDGGGEAVEISTRSGLLVRVPRDLEEDELLRWLGVLSRC